VFWRVRWEDGNRCTPSLGPPHRSPRFTISRALRFPALCDFPRFANLPGVVNVQPGRTMVVYKDSQEERKLDPAVPPRENARFRDAFKTKCTCILSPVDEPTR